MGICENPCCEEYRAGRLTCRDAEADAMHPEENEKIFDEADMWRLYNDGA